MEQLLQTPLLGISLTLIAYELALLVQKKCKGSPLANPLLIGLIIIIFTLFVFKIPIESYNLGGDIINQALVPLTAILGLNIYRQRDILKEQFVPVVFGCFAGCVFNALFIYLGCKLLNFDSVLTSSLIPRSVTTPIALSLSEQLGGIPSITMAAVLVTGVTGAALSPLLVKIFKIKSPVAAGVAIGTSSHALGTTTAIKLGDVQAAMSGISIGVAGILTVVISQFL